MNYVRLFPSVFLILFISGCCITPPSFSPSEGNIVYYPELSYRTSSYWGEDAKDDDLKHVGSVGFGIFGNWTICDEEPALGFTTGLLFNQFGSKYEYSSDEVSITRLSYLSIPFTFTYEVYNGIAIEAGPDLSFLLGAKEKYTYMGNTDSYDIKEDTRNVQIGFNVGVSYMHDDTGLGGFFRYNGGLNRVVSDEYDYKAYNGGLSVGLRYRVNQLFNK